MVWKVWIDTGLHEDLDEFTVCADNIDKAEESALRKCAEHYEEHEHLCVDGFRVVSVYCKVK